MAIQSRLIEWLGDKYLSTHMDLQVWTTLRMTLRLFRNATSQEDQLHTELKNSLKMVKVFFISQIHLPVNICPISASKVDASDNFWLK